MGGRQIPDDHSQAPINLFGARGNREQKDGNNSADSVCKILTIYMLTTFVGAYETEGRSRRFFEKTCIVNRIPLDRIDGFHLLGIGANTRLSYWFP